MFDNWAFLVQHPLQAARPLILLFLISLALQGQEPEKYALMIGINSYDHAELSKLDYAESDAKAIGEVLMSNGYNIDYLLGKNARLADIRSALNKCSEHGANKGVVVIGVFGHGIEFDSNKKSFYVPYDVRMKAVRDNDNKLLYADDGVPLIAPDREYMVAIDELLVALRESKARHKVLFADCCRDDPNRARFRSFGSSLRPNELPKDAAAFFACSENERAYEHKDWEHGAFTKCVLEQLAQGRTLMGSLAEEVAPAVEGLTESMRRAGDPAQTPRFLSTGARIDLLLAPKNASSNTGTPPNKNFARQIDQLRIHAYQSTPGAKRISEVIVKTLRNQGCLDDEFLFLESYLAPVPEKQQLQQRLQELYPDSYFTVASELDYLFKRDSSESTANEKQQSALLDRLIEMKPGYEYTVVAAQIVLTFSRFATVASKERCRTLLMDWLTTRPNDAHLHYAIGQHYSIGMISSDGTSSSDNFNALKHIEIAIALAPKTPEYLYSRAVILSGMKRFDEAITQCDEALALDPEYVYAALYKASCLFHYKSNIEEARNVLTKCLTAKADSSQFGSGGRLAEQMGLLPTAEKYLNKSIELDPSNLMAYESLVSVLLKTGKIKELIILQKQAHERLSAENAACVELILCTETGALKRAVELGSRYKDTFSSVVATRALRDIQVFLGDVRATDERLQSFREILSPKKLNALLQESTNNRSVTITVAAGQPGPLYLLTTTGVKQVAPGQSISIDTGKQFRSAGDKVNYEMISVPSVCFFTGDKTVLGEEHWDIATLEPGEQAIKFVTTQANGVTVWRALRP